MCVLTGSLLVGTRPQSSKSRGGQKCAYLDDAGKEQCSANDSEPDQQEEAPAAVFLVHQLPIVSLFGGWTLIATQVSNERDPAR
jgi:hypothetical protein